MTYRSITKARGVVDLDAPADERWLPVARQQGDQIHELMDSLDEIIEEQLGQASAHWRALGRSMYSNLGLSLITRVFSWASGRAGYDYLSEITSIADEVGIHPGRLLLGNMVYDLTQGLGLLGCSSISFDAAQGPVLARTLDWLIPEGLGAYSTTLDFMGSKGIYRGVTLPGFVGMLSAQADYRWALTVNMAPASRASMSPTQVPAMMHVRSVCDRMVSYRSTVSALRQTVTMSPLFIHVVGTKAQERVIIEHNGNETAIVAGGEEPLICTNHFQTAAFEERNEDAGGGIYENSTARYAALRRRVAKKRCGFSSGLSLLDRQPVTWEATVQRMVFQPAAGKITVQALDD